MRSAPNRVAGINDPGSTLVREALGRVCDCGAQPNESCRNIIADEPLPGRQVHYMRLEDR